MSNPLPLVTVITPAYNLAHYLPETIDSILDQDYDNIEYIVLDDGSKDNTREVLSHYTGKLYWETHENMGEASTVNKAWTMAKGDYIVVVNADDPIRPTMLSKLVAFMEKHTDVLAVYPDWYGIDEESEILFYNRVWDFDYKRMLREAGCVPGPGTLIRRKGIELENARNTNYKYVTDYEYWLRLGLHGPLARYPEALATHRTHASSAGVQFKPIVGDEIIEMLDAYFQNPNLPEDIKSLKAETLSSAYFEAGDRAATLRERRDYFIKSFRTYPKNWLQKPHRRAHWRQMIFPEIMRKVFHVIRKQF